MNTQCKGCDKDLSYSEEFDAYFCPRCKEWAETKCSDPECEFCSKRPPYPNEIEHECQCCYIRFTSHNLHEPYCKWCDSRKDWIESVDRIRLERMLDIMEWTVPARLPDILRVMVKYLSFPPEE